MPAWVPQCFIYVVKIHLPYRKITGQASRGGIGNTQQKLVNQQYSLKTLKATLHLHLIARDQKLL